jgi:hypothetical protein
MQLARSLHFIACQLRSRIEDNRVDLSGKINPDTLDLFDLRKVRTLFMASMPFRVRVFVALAVTFLPSEYVLAISLAEFDAEPVAQICSAQVGMLAKLLAERDKGLKLEDARLLSKWNAGGGPFPAETIEDVYAFRQLPIGAQYGYFIWGCQARQHGLKPLPLSAVAGELQACFNKKDDHPCGREIRNRVIGLAEPGKQK